MMTTVASEQTTHIKFNIYSKTKFLILTLKILELNWINFNILTRHRGFQHCQDSRPRHRPRPSVKLDIYRESLDQDRLRTRHLNLTVSTNNLNKNVENLESLELSWLSRHTNHQSSTVSTRVSASVYQHFKKFSIFLNVKSLLVSSLSW